MHFSHFFIPFQYLHTSLLRKKIQLQPPGEPREHRLGEVLKGRSKSKFDILFDSSVFLGAKAPLQPTSSEGLYGKGQK